MVRILYAGDADQWPVYRRTLADSLARAGVVAEITDDRSQPNSVDYVVYAPSSGLADFTPYTRLKAVLSLWAGVEKFQGNATLNVPLARMVDRGLTQGMAEWVLGQVMRHHLELDRYTCIQDGIWRNGAFVPPLAEERVVGFLGLGELGVAAGRMVGAVGFKVMGWSRRQKEVAGIDCRSGDAGLDEVLAASDILVLLLPQTAETTNVLNADRLARMPEGAVVINPGRGPLIDDSALLAALDAGRIGHATLDVFRVEPLPKDHPYWAHPRVTVTPHIAAETRPRTASDAIAENVRRGEAGEPFLYLVDRAAGY
jgi:glyoxylate/hydroxypyruvate reductase A